MKINGKQILTLAIAVTSPLLLSCEDVIKVDLNNVAPRLVIEGVISDKPGQSKFEISKTVDFFNPSIFPSVSDAQVIVADNLGNIDTLHESQPGVYTATDLIGVTGRTYIANVTIDSATYSASSQMEHTIAIDSMKTEYQPGGGIGSEEDEGYNCWFTSPTAPISMTGREFVLSRMTHRWPVIFFMMTNTAMVTVLSMSISIGSLPRATL